MIEKLKKPTPLTIVIVAMILGLLLILFSGKKETTEKSRADEFFNETAYEEELEKRLKGIIEDIDGVGDVKVMITLEGSAVFTYATDVTQDTKSDGDLKKASTVVLSANGTNNKEAVISGYSLPAIKGAAVVCSRTLTPTLQSKVIGVVSAALGISTNKIYVTN